MADPIKKECDQCGRVFECGPETGDDGQCWCAKLPNVVPMETGEDCLCPECLKEEVKANSGDV